MRFSPYRDENKPLRRSPQANALSSPRKYGDEAWDSGDEEYPVLSQDSVDYWEVFDQQSKNLVWKAAKAKAVEIAHVRDLARKWIRNTAAHLGSLSRNELSKIEDKLSSLKIEIKEEELRIAEDFGRRNEELWSGIEVAIEQAKREEALRAEAIRKQVLEEQRLKEEQEAARKRQEYEKAEKERIQRANEEKARSEKLERDRIAAEKIAAEKEQFDLLDRPKKEAEKFRAKFEEISSSVLKPVSEEKTWKAYCFAAKRKVTPKLGQLTPSKTQISRIITEIEDVFKEAKTVSEPVYQWMLNFFCEAALSQAETEVAVKPVAAYPLAYVCVSLLATHPSLPDIFFARLYTMCPWVIPWVEYDRTTEEGCKKLGYIRFEDGKWEDAASYNERQSGIFALWSAIIQTPHPNNAFPISYAWKFLSRMLNFVKDNNDGTPCFLVSIFFDICGKQFVRVYGKQARKLIECVVFGWIPTFASGAKGVEASTAGRLLDIGNKYLQSNIIGIENGGVFEA